MQATEICLARRLETDKGRMPLAGNLRIKQLGSLTLAYCDVPDCESYIEVVDHNEEDMFDAGATRTVSALNPSRDLQRTITMCKIPEEM